MGKKEAGQAGRGQRPITSFLFRASDQTKINCSHAGSTRKDPLVSQAQTAGPANKRPRLQSSQDAEQGLLSEDTESRIQSFLCHPESSAPKEGGPPATCTEFQGSCPGQAHSTIPRRDATRHLCMQRKLVGSGSSAAKGGAQTNIGATPSPASKLTPLEQQVVDLKRRHPGVLLIFEVGYKMRFFGSDAEAASRVLGIGCFPDHNFLTAYVPVPRLAVHVRRLVEAGFRVGVVKQVETSAIKAAGSNKSAPFERRLTGIFTRATLEAGELAGAGEWDSLQGSGTLDSLWSSQRLSSYLVCVVEDSVEGKGTARVGRDGNGASGLGGATPADEGTGAGAGAGKGGVEIGLVAVETSTGDVLYQQFRDSLMRPELESKLLFLAPAEVLATAPLSSPTLRLLNSFAQPAAPSSGATSAGTGARLEVVEGAKYRDGGALAAAVGFFGGRESETTGSPAAPTAVDSVLRLPPLVLRALAHAVDYLRPLGVDGVLHLGSTFRELSSTQELSLSPNTLRQLEILSNADDGRERGSLLWLLDHTLTPGGGRLMRRWVSRPLRGKGQIEERQDAVQELLEEGTDHTVLSRLPPLLSKLPDLERSLTRAFHGSTTPTEFVTMLRALSSLHGALGLRANLAAGARGAAMGATAEVPVGVEMLGAGGGRVEAGTTPDGGGCSRGDERGTGGQQVAERSSTNGAVHVLTAERGLEPPPLETGTRVPPVEVPGVKSALLRRLLAAAGDLGVTAAAQLMLSRIQEEAAQSNDLQGLFRESDPPTFPAVSSWRAEVVGAEKSLQDLLPALARQLNVRAVGYMSIQNQGDFLVEVPVELGGRVPKDWEKVCSTKKAGRYHPPQVKQGIQRLALAREHLQLACQAAWRELLQEFGQQYSLCRGAVQALAALDCLLSLAVLANNAGYTRPVMLDDSSPPQLHIEAGRHPVLDMTLGGGFVPNDTHLEGAGRTTLVVTGPNMGGKSVYIRQSALIAIMAQVGSYVPAASVRMHAMDAVFTRMGASDNIALGRSTFLEELGEASAILARATPRSLVVIDELGRGTSTRDGVAIAAATLQYVATQLGCLTLFVTHYPQVALLHRSLPDRIGTGYMDFIEGGDADGGASCAAAEATLGQCAQHGDSGCVQLAEDVPSRTPLQRDSPATGPQPAPGHALPHVTFLYTLREGVAPRSFGLNVARMAQLPPSVLRRATVLSAAFEAGGKGGQEGDGTNGCESAAAGRGGQASGVPAKVLQHVKDVLERGEWSPEKGRTLQGLSRAALD